jgi:uncharacterized membrane protein YgdD (TMEM256/DUF423 family)
MINETSKKKIITIAILGASGVALGALGAHFLKGKMQNGIITADHLAGFETAVKYQMYHTIAMLVLVVFNSQHQNKYFGWAHAFFFWGIILFSGSLYLLCTRNLFGADGLRFLGPITPLGGICFIIGWLCLIPAVLKNDKGN